MSGELFRVLVQTIKQYMTFFSLQQPVALYGAGTKAGFEDRTIRLEVRVIERYVERVQSALRKFCVHPYSWTIRIRSGTCIEQFSNRFEGAEHYELSVWHAEGEDGPYEKIGQRVSQHVEYRRMCTIDFSPRCIHPPRFLLWKLMCICGEEL